MYRFAIRKLAQGVLMLLLVSGLAFALLTRAGGDALTALRENPQVSAESIERLTEMYGLDRPVVVRYAGWLADLARGDLGESIYFRRPVSGLVLERSWNTARLGAAGLAIAVFGAVLFAFLTNRFRSIVLDRAVDLVVLMTASVPRIVLSLTALLVLGRVGAAYGRSALSFVLAAAALAIPLLSIFLSHAHAELRRAMDQDHVSYARAKGLSESGLIMRHAARTAVHPLLSLFGLSLGTLLSGSVIVETVLGWPGIGALTVAAVRNRDVPLVMGIVVVTCAAVWVGNTVAELLQMLNDKRLREAEVK